MGATVVIIYVVTILVVINTLDMLDAMRDTNSETTPLEQVFLKLVWAFSALYSCAAPGMITILLLFLHLNGILAGIVKEFASVVNARQMPLTNIVMSGWKVVDIFKALDSVFSKYIFVEALMSIVTLMVGLFFTIGFVPDLIQNPGSLGASGRITAFYQACISALCILKLTVLFGSGQWLLKETKNLKEQLDRLYGYEVHRMTKNVVTQIESLIWTFRTQAPIRPMDMFDLRMSSGLTAMSAMVTYVVILLQFKSGEQTSFPCN